MATLTQMLVKPRFARLKGVLLGLAPAALLAAAICPATMSLEPRPAHAAARPAVIPEPEASSYTFSEESEIKFTAYAPIRKDGVHGVSHEVLGNLTIPSGRFEDARVIIRTPITAFRGKREMIQHTYKAVGAARFPEVVFQGRKITVSTRETKPDGTHLAGTIEGNLDFHGVKKPIEAPFTAVLSRDLARVKTEFPVSLSLFGIERPKIMFVEVDDPVRISADLVAQKH